jgi:hypothetical protein
MAPRTIKPAAVKAPTADQKIVKALAKALADAKPAKKATRKTVAAKKVKAAAAKILSL